MRVVSIAMIALAACSGRDRDERADGEGAGASAADQAKATQIETNPEPNPEIAPETAPAATARSARKQACLRDHVEPARPRDQALLRSLCAEWVEREIPGVALAIVEPQTQTQPQPVHVELGVRCHGQPGLVERTTAFRLGSITKTLTASLAHGLVARGELSLDTRVGALVPAFVAPRGLAEPSLDDLLGHRSGLGEIDPEDLVELDGAWLPALARSAPGTVGELRYSNVGYSLVGAMLVAASNRSYVDLVADEIAKPAGLASLTADPTQAVDPACGHLADDPERRPISVRDDLAFMPGDPSWMTPAGGALASATDLARFALALGTARLPGTATMLEAPATPLPPERAISRRHDERYGHGLRTWTLADGTRAYGHSGDNVAFRAELVFVPGRRAIVLLANRGTELTASVVAAEALLEAP